MTQPLPPPVIGGLTYLSRLGSGGYADVYLYEQAMPSRKVAVKVLRDPGLASGVVARFTAEANAMAQLEHPHIVPVYSAATAGDGRPYIVMMYYPQASLAERAKRERLAVAEVLRIGIQIASAVETAHRAGLLHRDIKPANVLTNQYGTPGLTDFGIAAQVADEDDDTGVSVPWSPAETIYASSPATPASDVYSLGATLWHLLVGRSPFEVPGGDNSTFALMRRIRDAPAPSTGRPDVPTSLDRVLRSAMAKNPALRPASALELARALQAVEQELRFPRTDIVLADEGGAPMTLPRSALGTPTPAQDADSTRRKAPQRVAAQAPALRPVPAPTPVPGTTPAAAAIPQAGTPQHRSDPDEAPEGLTLRRDAAGPAPTPEWREPDPDTHLRAREDAVAFDPERRGGQRWGLVAVAAIVVMALAVLGYWLIAGQGQPAVGPTPTRTPTQPPPALGEATLPAPGVAAVVATRTGGQVVFTWTYSSAAASDYYLVSVSGQDQPVRVEDPTYTVARADQVCVGVRIARGDGSNLQKGYSPKVCA